MGLGLAVARPGDNRGLLVKKVIIPGAIDSWNRQVAGGPQGAKAILPGDLIVQIGDRVDSSEMLHQCFDSQLIKMYIVRGAGTVAPPAHGGHSVLCLLSDGSFRARWSA